LILLNRSNSLKRFAGDVDMFATDPISVDSFRFRGAVTSFLFGGLFDFQN
jgi:hypothetical protein